MLQIGAASFYYKLGQTLLQIGAASLLQIRASVVTNWGSYYKLGQALLQNRAAITNWGNIYYKLGRYYKLGQLLQIGAQQQYPIEHLSSGKISQRYTNFLSEFKSKINTWKCDTCLCRLCKPFLQNLGFI